MPRAQTLIPIGIKMKKLLFCAAAAATLSLPALSLAGETENTMPEVVVSATRTESGLDRVGGSSVTVIDAQEIAAKKPATVAEALKGVPGLDIRSNGGKGTNTSIHLRGADNKYTLVLVDGIMYNDPSQGQRGANIGSLTMDNVERIEVIRGPMSVLYGSNANAGVINIITKKGAGKPTVNAGFETGSEKSWKVDLGSSGKKGRLDYSISASQSATEGFSIADEDNDRIPQAGNTEEKDGWDNLTLSTRLGFEITPDFRIETIIRHLESTTELDDNNGQYAGDRFGGWPSYPAEPDGIKERREESKQCLARINVKNDLLDNRLSSDLALQTARLDRDSFDNDGRPSYDYTGMNREATWQGTLRMVPGNLITVGASFFREEMDSDSSSISDKSAETTSLWLEDQILAAESVDIVAGVRGDHHDRFGSKTTFRLAPAYHLRASGTTLKASYSTGFRAPSLYELYSSYGNENLGAEKNEGYDIGVEQKLFDKKIKLALTWFALDFDDRIAFDFTTWKYGQQDGVTRTHGVESAINYAVGDALDLGLTYTYTDTEDPDGARLARRPLNKAALNGSYRFGDKGSIDCDLIWVGKRDTSYAYDKDGNNVDTLASYTVVNLTGRYFVNDHVELYARIENLFDKYYEEAWSYATPGLSLFTGARISY